MTRQTQLVEVDWTLLHSCNFRCDYCFVPVDLLGEKIKVRASPEEWETAFSRYDVKWQIHITGGEPSNYPRFVDLCYGLTRTNVISLNSNLSNRSILTFADRIDPQSVIFINAGLHYQERSHRSDPNVFIERASMLARKGFNTLVSAVMSPAMIEIADDVSQKLAVYGVTLVPKALRGAYDGKNWPHAYTSAQKHKILRLLDKAQAKLENVQALASGQASIDMNFDRKLLGRGAGLVFKLRDLVSDTEAIAKMFRGKECGAGVSFVSMSADGAMHRCSSKRYLGNLLDTSLKFMEEPQRCDTQYCPYFCAKHTNSATLDRIRKYAPVAVLN